MAELCRAVQRQTVLVDGNSVSAKLVRESERGSDLTDSDDIAANNARRVHCSLPLMKIASDPEHRGVVRGARHQQAGRETSMPISNGRTCWRSWLQTGTGRRVAPNGRTRPQPDWEGLLAGLEAGTTE